MRYIVSDRYYMDEIEVETVLTELYDEEEAMKICKVSDCILFEDMLLINHPILGDIVIKNDDVTKYSFFERKVQLKNLNFLSYPDSKTIVSLSWNIDTAYDFLKKRYPDRDHFKLSFICHVINNI